MKKEQPFNPGQIKEEFIKWINKEENFKKSYDGLVTEPVLEFWNKTYFDSQLFSIDSGNIPKSIRKIESLTLNTDNTEWIRYSQATSKGAPMAVLGKNNYLKFLNELAVDVRNDLFTFTQSQNQSKFKLSSFIDIIVDSGLNYSRQIILRYVSSLATKPFVLLSGLSGSGKTKLAQSFAQWICASKDQYCIVPVGADWTNREPLLGYINALNTKQYILPENKALELIIRANNDKSKPYFLILDEMNLSHVERYFADFLSIMESNDNFKLHSSKENLNNNKEEEFLKATEVPSELAWPKNLFVVGTVNIDETTYMFSPKVLDRANVIEFRINEEEMRDFLEKPKEIRDLDGEGAGMAEDFVKISTNKSKLNHEKLTKALNNFFRELQKVDAEFGYRTASEIQILFNKIDEVNPDYSDKENEKIDIAIMQKLLPKLHGSRSKLVAPLKVLASLCYEQTKGSILSEKEKNEIFDKTSEINNNVKYPISLEKITRMHRNLLDNGFTSYAEA